MLVKINTPSRLASYVNLSHIIMVKEASGAAILKMTDGANIYLTESADEFVNRIYSGVMREEIKKELKEGT